MSKPGRAWFPCDASLTEDPRILRAGEPAGWLFVAILGKIRRTGAPGTITNEELSALPVRGTERRLQALIDVGLVERVPKQRGIYAVPSWRSWQPDEDRAAYMRRWRAQKRAEANGDNGSPPDGA